MSELLLEILSEEIPARMQKRASEDLKRLVTDGLKKAGLTFDSAEAFATPRRLMLVVDGLPEKQPDVRDERKGPKVGAPDKAIEGFLRSAGLDSLDQCEKRDTGKGEAWFVVIERAGQPTADVLPTIIREVITSFSWPKSMRFGYQQLRWVRPMHSVLAIFDGRMLSGSINTGSKIRYQADGLCNGAGRIIPDSDEVIVAHTIDFTNITVGHRFLAPDSIAVTEFADYKAKLAAAHVMLDPAERRALIERDLNKLVSAEGLTVKEDVALLDEVTGLVEWPVVLLGDIDAAFMDLPAEALTSSMRAHQKYFALLDADGNLAPRFGFVANMAAKDGGKAIVAGNERVLRARLADAKFFWDQDRKVRLADRSPALDAITFHAKLGTVAAKAQRIAAIAADLTDNIPGADRDAARGAALLCKADLVTGMVGEFPDLQGVMGRYYAIADGEKASVADAVAQHYSPVGPNDRCPTAPVSVAVALADKIDTLVGFWLIDEKPTGSKDPYALRRAALGVIRLILENKLRLNLLAAFATAMRLYQEEKLVLGDASKAAENLLSFFADRLKVYLREKGVRHDLIAAVFALGDEDDLVRLMARVGALGGFLGSDDGENLLVAFRRAANIVRIESKKDGAAFAPDAYDCAKAEGDEASLWTALAETSGGLQQLLEQEGFASAMASMAKLRAPVDRFFDNVTVNADDADIRRNRLCLLANLTAVMRQVADFSQIEG